MTASSLKRGDACSLDPRLREDDGAEDGSQSSEIRLLRKLF